MRTVCVAAECSNYPADYRDLWYFIHIEMEVVIALYYGKSLVKFPCPRFASSGCNQREVFLGLVYIPFLFIGMLFVNHCSSVANYQIGNDSHHTVRTAVCSHLLETCRGRG